MKKIYTLLIILSSCFYNNTLGETTKYYESKVDSLLNSLDFTNSPGCVLGVMQDGKFMYKKAFGMANIDSGISLTTESIFGIMSITKQFTAACILLLAQEGKLSLKDDIRKYFPEMPDYGDIITISQLIHHISGIRDCSELQNLSGYPEGHKWGKEKVLEIIFRQKELNNKPGDNCIYNNSGYFLLGLIVEKVTGLSLNEYASREIFGPLGMKNTFYLDSSQYALGNIVSGHTKNDSNIFQTVINTLDGRGAGGIFSTIEDLKKWDDNFYNSKIGKRNFISKMYKVGKLNNGSKPNYSFGLYIRERNGLKTVEHGGFGGGFRTGLMRFPDEHFTVVCLTNRGIDIDTEELCSNVANIYLKEKMSFPTTPNKEKSIVETGTKPVSHNTEISNKRGLVGKYYSEEIDTYYEISQNNELIYLSVRGDTPIQLNVVNEDLLVLGELGKGITFKLERSENEIKGFRLSSERVKNLRFLKVD
ncbi:MAG: beta-lactamase family protein [Bacteroidia bacterium]|nr:beta-lactamase family protein [Bacteroidia bacterium]